MVALFLNLILFNPNQITSSESKFTIKDAVNDLKIAFEKGLLPNSLTDEKYFNIKRMQSIELS